MDCRESNRETEHERYSVQSGDRVTNRMRQLGRRHIDGPNDPVHVNPTPTVPLFETQTKR